MAHTITIIENAISLMTSNYHGRFAPTPSGHLHLGSLYIALAGWLDAEHEEGKWSIRFDDLDQARMQTGATDSISYDLTRFGLVTCQPSLYQHTRRPLYQTWLNRLIDDGIAYPCAYSRKEVQALGGKVTPENRKTSKETSQLVWRAALTDNPLGDPILWRRDQIPGYFLATLVDDIDMGITHIIRGQDLYDVSQAQQKMLAYLDQTMPQFFHLPLITVSGEKLAKRHQSDGIKHLSTSSAILACYQAYGFSIDHLTSELSLDALLAFGKENWKGIKHLTSSNSPVSLEASQLLPSAN